MRRNADVVIVGGGIIGASIAYHLTKKGVRDILVLERDRLGSGSTGKNAGGIRLQFSSEINVKLSQRSLPHIERFADEIGTDPHFHQVGYLFPSPRIAMSTRSNARSRCGRASAFPRAR